MFCYLPKPKTALRSLLFLCILTTAASAFAQDEFLEMEQKDIPGFAGMYEVPGSNPPKLIVMMKNPERAGTEIAASAIGTQSLGIRLPSPNEILEAYDEEVGEEFGSEYYLRSPDGTLTTQSATEAVQYRFVNYSITELYTWRDAIFDELKTFSWFDGIGVATLDNSLTLVVRVDIETVQDDIAVSLKKLNIPSEVIELEEGTTELLRLSGGSSRKKDSVRDVVRPLVAGIEIQTEDAFVGSCSLGWFAQKGRKLGFVTAWHCVGLGVADWNIKQDANGPVIAKAYEEDRRSREGPYDVLFAELRRGDFTREVAWPNLRNSSSGPYEFSTKRDLQGTASESRFFNRNLYFVGRTTGRTSSYIAERKYLDYKYNSDGVDKIVSCVDHLRIDGGDSGGPVILEDGRNLYLAGFITSKVNGRGCFTSARDAASWLKVNFLY